MNEMTYATINDAIKQNVEKQLSDRAKLCLVITRRWYQQNAVTLRENLRRSTGSEVSLSRVYAAVKELHDAGLVSYHEGQKCRHYRLTPRGVEIADVLRDDPKESEPAEQPQPATWAVVMAAMTMFIAFVAVLYVVAQIINWFRG